MMNYVAIQLVAYYIIIWESPKGSGKVGIINQSGNEGWLPSIGHYQYLLNILIVAIITAGMFIYLKYSKHGYEISVVGESQRTASYVGIKVDRVIVRTLLVSGGICGLCGFLMVAGTDHTITTTLAGGRGFLGVLVAWLAQFNPLAMVLVSLLLCVLSKGRGRDLHGPRTEPVLRRYPDGYHPVLHHRKRILHQLPDHTSGDPVRKQGARIRSRKEGGFTDV